MVAVMGDKIGAGGESVAGRVVGAMDSATFSSSNEVTFVSSVALFTRIFLLFGERGRFDSDDVDRSFSPPSSSSEASFVRARFDSLFDVEDGSEIEDEGGVIIGAEDEASSASSGVCKFNCFFDSFSAKTRRCFSFSAKSFCFNSDSLT